MFPKTMTLNYDIQKHKSCDKNICLLQKGIPSEHFHHLDKEWDSYTSIEKLVQESTILLTLILFQNK